jgi:hypothetical protein
MKKPGEDGSALMPCETVAMNPQASLTGEAAALNLLMAGDTTILRVRDAVEYSKLQFC